MSPFENADYTEEVSITSLGGLDFTNMANNEIIRKTSDTTAEGSGTTIQDEVAGEFYIKKIFNFINVPPFNILLGGILNSYNILTSSYKTQIAPKSSSIGSSQGLFLTSTVLDGNIKVGINISEPEEELEIDGNIQIDSGNQARLKFQKSGGSPHALGEIDGEQDGTNGGTLEFYTKVDGGSVTEKLRINNKGAIGVGGANFGNDGQFLMSKGNAAVPVWSGLTFFQMDSVGFSTPISGNVTADLVFTNYNITPTTNLITYDSSTGKFSFSAAGAGTYHISLRVSLVERGVAGGSNDTRFYLVKNNTFVGFSQFLNLEHDNIIFNRQGQLVHIETFTANDTLYFKGRMTDVNQFESNSVNVSLIKLA